MIWNLSQLSSYIEIIVNYWLDFPWNINTNFNITNSMIYINVEYHSINNE